MFSRNVGQMDRGARLVLGLALIAGFFAQPEAAYGWVYLVGGAIGLATGLVGSCGVYTLFGLNTCGKAE